MINKRAGMPAPDYTDQFAPDRSRNRQVTCLHCSQAYPETEAVYEVRPEFSVNLAPGEALWWCRNRRCDGAGVGYDLQPAHQRAPHVVTIDGSLYGYGESREAAVLMFIHQIAGGSARMQTRMRGRCAVTAIDDDHASEVAEMLDAKIIRWETRV